MEVFPLLIPEDEVFRSFHGYISVQGKEYKFHLHLGSNGSIADAVIHCSPELRFLLKGYEQIIKHRLARSSDVKSFMLELKDILERIHRSTGAVVHTDTSCKHLQMFSRLITELQTIGWNRILSIDASLTALQIRLFDSAGRAHDIQLNIPPDYPMSSPLCSVDLPVAVDSRCQRAESIVKIIERYSQALESFQDFWNVMDHLDQHTWVLEPEYPSRGATMRRVAIGNHCSIQVDVDPLHPRALPEIRFWGADSVIAPLRQHLNKSLQLHLWDHDAILLDNLQKALGVTFPSPQTTHKEKFLIECGICYSYRIMTNNDDGSTNNAIPDHVCDFPKCSRTFHRCCLYEWLKSLPNSHHSFDTIFGSCPYCTSPISVSR
jgi:E3 ubiquitin-protein ligase FANCL